VNQLEPLNVYSLPSQTVLQSYPAPAGTGCQADFTVAGTGSGTVLGQATVASYYLEGSTQSREVGPLAGGSTIWADAAPVLYDASGTTDLEGIHLSPDGTMIAVSNNAPPGEGPLTPNSSTAYLYLNGTLVNAVPGWVVGWIDNGSVLVNNYGLISNGAGDYLGYTNSTIYTGAGTAVSTVTLPTELHPLQPVSSTEVYSPEKNAVYSLTDGSIVWSTPISYYGLGAVAGPYVVFQSGPRILVGTY
jgi:hypothetical protein